MIIKTLLALWLAILISPIITLGQNVTPSLVNRNFAESSSALVSGARHPLILSNVPFRSLFNDLLTFNRSQSTRLLEGAYDPRAVNAFFFGASFSTPFTNIGRLIGLSSGQKTGLSYSSTSLGIKFNIGGLHVQAYNKSDRIQSSLDRRQTSLLSAGLAYLLIPRISVGASFDFDTSNDAGSKNIHLSGEVSATVNVYKRLYAALRTRVGFLIPSGYLPYFTYSFGGGFSIDGNTALFSNIRYEAFFEYVPETVDQPKAQVGPDIHVSRSSFVLKNYAEAQVSNFIVSYQKTNVWILKSKKLPGDQGSTIWQDKISFTVSAVGNFSRTGIDLIQTVQGPEFGVSFGVQEFAISQSFVF